MRLGCDVYKSVRQQTKMGPESPKKAPKRMRHDKVATLCPECGQVFSSDSHMKRHLLNVHQKSEFSCSSCQEMFSCKRNLALHLHSTRHGFLPNYSGVICLNCDSLFSQLRLLKTHAEQAHAKEIVSYSELFSHRVYMLPLKPLKNTACDGSISDKFTQATESESQTN